MEGKEEMSNNLIWRQSVIELIDDLMKSPYANSPQFGVERRECMDLVKELCVHRLTTAYDVDNVIKQIEMSSTDEDGIVCYVDKKPVITKEMAIKIVKSGGIKQE